jgi:hypothetical protein
MDRWPRIPGHDGLFARQLPIASSCFLHMVIHGFFRRRFDLFAIASGSIGRRAGLLKKLQLDKPAKFPDTV